MTAFISWYILITLLGWITFPLAYRLFPALADRGYTLSRAFGLMLWGFIFWLSANFGFAQNDLGLVVVNPAFPFGVNDIGPTPTGKLIIDIISGLNRTAFKGGFNVVDVRDVAKGHILAAERGKTGECYLVDREGRGGRRLAPEASQGKGNEAHPGGRWYRDLGGNNGHVWAFVQSIKRPVLLEFWGPLFMSTGASSNG